MQGFRIGSIAGIEIRLHWSLVAIFWLISYSLATDTFPALAPKSSPVALWIAAIVTAVVYLAGLLAHELGHSLLARRKGLAVDNITLWLFGGVASLKGEAHDGDSEMRIGAIGPGVSLALGAVFYSVATGLDAVGAPVLVVAVLVWLGIANVALAVFNLLPAFPLDGGRVFRGWLWKRSGDEVKATRTAAMVGRGFGYGLMVLGAYFFMTVSALNGLWFIFLGWFLLGAARGEESQTVVVSALHDVKVSQVMTPNPVTVSADALVADFMNQAMTQRFVSFPVVDAAGQVVGLMTLGRLKEMTPAERERTKVGDAAWPIAQTPTVSPNDSAVTLLQGLQGFEDARALVFDAGRLVGIVSPRDLQRVLELMNLRQQGR